MADDTKPAGVPIDLVIDCSAMAGFLVDLAPGERRGLLTAQEGCDAALHEVFGNQEAIGGTAGVTAEDIEVLQATTAELAMIDAKLPALRKLVEVLEESRAVIEDRRQRRLAGLAYIVEARATIDGNPELLAQYEKTRAYRSATGIKAAKARRRNAAARAAAARARQDESAGSK